MQWIETDSDEWINPLFIVKTDGDVIRPANGSETWRRIYYRYSAAETRTALVLESELLKVIQPKP